MSLSDLIYSFVSGRNRPRDIGELPDPEEPEEEEPTPPRPRPRPWPHPRPPIRIRRRRRKVHRPPHRIRHRRIKQYRKHRHGRSGHRPQPAKLKRKRWNREWTLGSGSGYHVLVGNRGIFLKYGATVLMSFTRDGTVAIKETPFDPVETPTNDDVDDAIETALAAQTADDMPERVLQLYRRQGSMSTHYSQEGTTTYTPGNVWVQAGSFQAEDAEDGDEFEITFPVAFENNPIIFIDAQPGSTDVDEYRWLALINHSTISETGFSLRTTHVDHLTTSEVTTLIIHWLAIGPPAEP